MKTETSYNLKIPRELTVPRFVEPSGLSEAEAKAICEEHGVVWGCD